MALTNKDLAAHFNVTPSRAAALVRAGCPLDSLEAATTWREARLLRGQRGGVEVRAPINYDRTSIQADTTFEETVQRHRDLKEDARQQYIAARDAGDPNQNKLYQTYEKIAWTLVKFEREALARAIESKELIKVVLAVDKLTKILIEIKADLLAFGMEVATAANPESPGTALKAIDAHAQKLLAKWSQAQTETIAEMVTPEQIIAPELPPSENFNGDISSDSI